MDGMSTMSMAMDTAKSMATDMVMSTAASMAMTTASSMASMVMPSGSSMGAMSTAMVAMHHAGMDMGGSNSTGHGTGHDMSGMDHMDMGSGHCKISMTWNWYTIDSCFLSTGWHVKTRGQFAGTCIGVFCWSFFLLVWRMLRMQLDAYIAENRVRRYERVNGQIAQKRVDTPSDESSTESDTKFPDAKRTIGEIVPGTTDVRFSKSGQTLVRPNVIEQLIRALMFGFEYSIVWLLGLILMSYNGYVIISAFLGAFLGFMFVEWRSIPAGPTSRPVEATHCC